jgi:hypothetical protein
MCVKVSQINQIDASTATIINACELSNRSHPVDSTLVFAGVLLHGHSSRLGGFPFHHCSCYICNQSFYSKQVTSHQAVDE